jgi:hypothetical protein
METFDTYNIRFAAGVLAPVVESRLARESARTNTMPDPQPLDALLPYRPCDAELLDFTTTASRDTMGLAVGHLIEELKESTADLPAVKHLMLRQDVVDACARGAFHIYAVSTAD